MAAAAATITTKQKLERVFYFFPFQLFLLHLKRNYLLLFSWLFLFLLITQNFATKYGGHYLFLYPEYLGNVDFFSHLIIGFACGGFIMAFNISSYIINGYKFPFLATLSKPFLKYCINNFLIPGTFVLSYLFLLVKFQLFNEVEPTKQVILNGLGFITGNLVFIYISLLYFRYTNKDIFKLFGFDIEKKVHKNIKSKKNSGFAEAAFYRRVKWYHFFHRLDEWRVDTYLNGFIKISLARDSKHYHKSLLQTVFAQNHINASLFELLVIGTLIILGLFREIPLFQIPAGASVFLLFTIIIMIGSAMHSWLKGWSSVAFLVTIFVAIFISRYNVFNYTNYAYGMDYTHGKAKYNIEEIQNLSYQNNYSADTSNTIAILNKWLASTGYHQTGNKPKLVLINTSGGGLRSMMWTVHSLQYTDSILNGKLFKDARLMTGASGGLMGAAFIRELYLRKLYDPSINIYDDKYLENISKDMLNPVAFSYTLNDLFFRVQRFQLGEHKYTKDRGYIFEQVFNRNTSGILNKIIIDYRDPEREALIPMMVISPTIINDGRRIMISAQPVSYLTSTSALDNVKSISLVESIEFRRFFKDQEADSLLFTTALRMNATFPYIMPYASLPSEPAIEVMDAGIRDNYGFITSLKYLYTFREWIKENTSGVVIVQIRDIFKEDLIQKSDLPGLIQNIVNPVGSFYNVWPDIQNYSQDELIQYASLWFNGNIDVVPIQMKRNDELISLSWHLTRNEKEKIIDAINLPENQASIAKLKLLLAEPVVNNQLTLSK